MNGVERGRGGGRGGGQTKRVEQKQAAEGGGEGEGGGEEETRTGDTEEAKKETKKKKNKKKMTTTTPMTMMMQGPRARSWLVVSRALCHRVMPISSKASCTTVLGYIPHILQRKINRCATAPAEAIEREGATLARSAVA